NRLQCRRPHRSRLSNEDCLVQLRKALRQPRQSPSRLLQQQPSSSAIGPARCLRGSAPTAPANPEPERQVALRRPVVQKTQKRPIDRPTTRSTLASESCQPLSLRLDPPPPAPGQLSSLCWDRYPTQ